MFRSRKCSSSLVVRLAAFVGRVALVAVVLFSGACAVKAEVFCVAVIPDTQNYVDYANRARYNPFVDEMRYLADNKDALNLEFVTHVGDVVQHGDLSTKGDVRDGEWKRAWSAMNILSGSGVPFGMSPGNHDYDNFAHSHGNRPIAGGVKWNQYFGPGSPFFAGKSWYGGSYNGGMDSFQTFSGGGCEYLHLSLEMLPKDDVIDWAQSVIDAHPHTPTIITTHCFLNPTATSATRNDSQPRSHDLGIYFPGRSGNNSPDQIWQKLIKCNDQIFVILCGHAFTGADGSGVSNGENLRIDNNDFGHPVYQILTDYQGNTFDYNAATRKYTGGKHIGGDGWIRLMTFDTEAGTIHFQTYSPTLHLYAGVGNGPTFKINPSFSDFTLPIPSQARQSAAQ